MARQGRFSNRLSTVIIIVVSLIGVAVIASDWKEMRAVLARSNGRYLLGGIAFTFISYACYSYAYALVSQMLGIRMRKYELAEACFLSSVINHVVTTGGVVGYSLRYLLMKRYGVSLKETLSSSILHYYLISLNMLVFFPLAYLYLMLNADVPRGVAIGLGVVTVIYGLVLVIFTMVILFPSRRGWMVSLFSRLGRVILHRDFHPWLIQMDETFTAGTQAILQRPMMLVWTMFLALVDNICNIVAIGFCFYALGPSVHAGVLFTGYVIGIMVGILSMIPGGFGVQEGSMTGIFVLFGVQYEQAVLSSILFRIVYYLLPYTLIPLFYNQLIRKAKEETITEP